MRVLHGETAVAASPALALVATDFGWRAGRPIITALADRAGEWLARTFAGLQRRPHNSAAVSTT
jgi:hypothetical protein